MMRDYGKVIVRGTYQNDKGEDVPFEVKRDVPGGGDEIYRISGLYRQSVFEAEQLAKRKVEFIVERRDMMKRVEERHEKKKSAVGKGRHIYP